MFHFGVSLIQKANFGSQKFICDSDPKMLKEEERKKGKKRQKREGGEGRKNCSFVQLKVYLKKKNKVFYTGV